MYPEAPVRNPAVVQSSSGSDIILYQPVRRQAHVLNRSAAFVWEHCDGEHSPATMVAEARRTFEATPSGLDEEIGRLLEQFHALDLTE